MRQSKRFLMTGILTISSILYSSLLYISVYEISGQVILERSAMP